MLGDFKHKIDHNGGCGGFPRKKDKKCQSSHFELFMLANNRLLTL